MADILIRGMEMPTKCWTCWMKHGCFAFPSVLYDKSIEYNERIKKKSDNCPLVELPEHVDLISLDDAKTVITRFLGYIDDDLVFRMKFKLEKDCPVIIPSNKEESE